MTFDTVSFAKRVPFHLAQSQTANVALLMVSDAVLSVLKSLRHDHPDGQATRKHPHPRS